MILQNNCKLQIVLKKWQCRINFYLFVLFLVSANISCDQSDTVVEPDIDSFDQTLIISTTESINFQSINASPFNQSKINTDSRLLLSIQQHVNLTSKDVIALIHGIHLVKDTLYLDYGQSVQFGDINLERNRITDTLINNESVNYTFFKNSFIGQRANLPVAFADVFIHAKTSILKNNNSSKRLDSFQATFKPTLAIEITNINPGKIVAEDENLVVRFNKRFSAEKTIIGLTVLDKNLVIRASQSRDFILIKSNILADFKLLVNQSNFTATLWVIESDVVLGQLAVNETGSSIFYGNSVVMQSVFSTEIIL